MRIRHAVLASAVAAGVTLGIGGVASAQTPTTPTAPTTKATNATRCERAEARLPSLNTRRANLEARIDKLNAAIAKARAAHHDDRVDKLSARLVKVQAAHDHVVDLINRIHATCDAT
jgi:uncharacterized coiled-coil protein SlyX